MQVKPAKKNACQEKNLKAYAEAFASKDLGEDLSECGSAYLQPA